MPENQAYWTQRWADQMNFRYWKERCLAETASKGRAGATALLRGHESLQDG